METITTNVTTPTNVGSNLLMKSLVGIISLTVISAAGYYYYKQNNVPAVAPVTTTIGNDSRPQTKKITLKDTYVVPTGGSSTDGTSQPTTIPTTASQHYKNGTYTVTGAYRAPSGAEKLSVAVSLLNDKIISATFAGSPTSPASKKFQEQFSTGFKGEVVGKSIDEVSLTVVNGSSLTPKGFMDALSKVKAQAKNS